MKSELLSKSLMSQLKYENNYTTKIDAYYS